MKTWGKSTSIQHAAEQGPSGPALRVPNLGSLLRMCGLAMQQGPTPTRCTRKSNGDQMTAKTRACVDVIDPIQRKGLNATGQQDSRKRTSTSRRCYNMGLFSVLSIQIQDRSYFYFYYFLFLTDISLPSLSRGCHPVISPSSHDVAMAGQGIAESERGTTTSKPPSRSNVLAITMLT